MTVSQTIRGQYNCLEVSGVCYAGRYEKEMLLQNEYTYLPRRIIGTVNNDEIISYQIDGYKSLSDKWDRTCPNLKDVQELISDLIKCIEELNDHLLSADNLMLDDRYIFYDSVHHTYRFLYAPSPDHCFAIEIKQLFERIMLVYDHSNKEEVGVLYDMYSLLLTDNLSVGMFCENVLKQGTLSKYEQREKCENGQWEIRPPDRDDMENEGVNNINVFTAVDQKKCRPDVNTKQYVSANKTKSELFDLKCKLIIMVYVLASCAVYVLFGQVMIRFIAIALVAVSIYVGWDVYERKCSRKKNEGYAPAIYAPMDKAPLDMKEEMKYGYELVPSNNTSGSEHIVIDDGFTTIGRRAESCDFCLPDEEISRIHAVIEKHGNQLTVTDKGSKNGTYINNIPVIQEQPHELNYGDKLRLATLEYVVCQNSNKKRG